MLSLSLAAPVVVVLLEVVVLVELVVVLVELIVEMVVVKLLTSDHLQVLILQ